MVSGKQAGGTLVRVKKNTRQTKDWDQAVRRLAVTSISIFISGL